MKTKNKIGIIGGAGYTAGELLRILLNHPHVSIEFVHSNSNAGKKIFEIHTDLLGETELNFSAKIDTGVDVLFICSGHGKTRQILVENKIPDTVKIIDLSNEFRLEKYAGFGNRQFIYGLPEKNKKEISQASAIANPGCFATAIQLAILPLAYQNLLQQAVHVHAVTGSTGAGQKPCKTTHYSWRNNNLSIYKPFTHQHLDEVQQTMGQLQPESVPEINFIPVRGNFARGIFASIYTEIDLDINKLCKLYRKYYQNHPFTIITDTEISLKNVTNTNKCILKIEKINNKLLTTSVIDNLIKGASGQAVQNMNLMLGLKETSGLHLKSLQF